MSVLLRIVVTVFLVCVGVPAIHRLYGYLYDKRHVFDCLPTGVRYASLLELMFGYLVILLSIGTYLMHIKENAAYWPFLLLGVAVGLFWVKMSMLLRRGYPLARRICLLLSLIRIGTIFGILFSIPSICFLFGKQAKVYFGKKGGTEKTPIKTEIGVLRENTEKGGGQ